ncbi:hypothetical protein D043_2621A, partial [Vibrio parahaemolyticus EKP-021]
MNNYPP